MSSTPPGTLRAGVPSAPAPPMSESDTLLDMERAGPRLVVAQQHELPSTWRSVDRGVVRATEATLFAVGALFAAMITLAVISRYVLDFSMFFVDASARLLLVWFFLLGAGIALRHGAHVGFELLLSRLSPGRQRTVRIAGYVLSLVFFAEMIWGGLYALRPATAQTDAGLGISLVWIVAAVPVGFLLLAYHAVVLLYIEAKRPLSLPRP